MPAEPAAQVIVSALQLGRLLPAQVVQQWHRFDRGAGEWDHPLAGLEEVQEDRCGRAVRGPFRRRSAGHPGATALTPDDASLGVADAVAHALMVERPETEQYGN